MHQWAREWLARPPSAPVVLMPAAGLAQWPEPQAAPTQAPFEIIDLDGGGALVPHFSTVKIAQLGWPESRGGWVRLELECDPRRSPPLRCTIDGEETPLEQVEPGIWRPTRPAPTKVSG